MLNRWLLVGLFSLTIILTGCVVYQPQAVDIPLINKKKDLRIDAGISNLSFANATISYGLTDKVAVQTFGSYQSGERYYFSGCNRPLQKTEYPTGDGMVRWIWLRTGRCL